MTTPSEPRPPIARTLGTSPPAGAGPPPAPATARHPRAFGRFQVVRELGRGAMGIVLHARDPRLERDVALKIIDPTLCSGDALARFRREAQATASLRHPSIVEVHEVGQEQGRAFIVMELVQGESLAARLRREGPLAPRVAVELVRDLASALGHAHGAGIVHRDVKPDNVLVGPGGRPKLVDFGIARAAGSALTRTGTMLGTPAYMAPEQAGDSASTHGPPADVYATGALLHHCLTGQPPFDTSDLASLLSAILTRRPAAPSRSAPAVDRALDAIVLRCLEKSPADRFADGDALAAALDGWLTGAAASPAKRSRRPLLVAAGALAAGALAVGALAVAPRPEPEPGAAPAPAPRAPAVAAPPRPAGVVPAPEAQPALTVREVGPAVSPYFTDDPTSLALAPDQAFLVVGTGFWSDDARRPGHLHVLSLPGLAETAAWRAHATAINALHVARDGWIVSGGNDGAVHLWARNGRRIASLQGAGSRAPVSAIVDVGAAGSERIVVVRRDGTCTPIVVDGARLLGRTSFPFAPGDVRNAVVLPGGRFLAAAGGAARIVDVEREHASDAPGALRDVIGVARRASDGLIAGVTDDRVCIVDLDLGRAATASVPGRWRHAQWTSAGLLLGGHGCAARTVEVGRADLSVTGGEDGVGPAHSWRGIALASGELIVGGGSRLHRLPRPAPGWRAEPAAAAHDVSSLAISPDGQWAIAGGYSELEEGAARRYDLRQGVVSPAFGAGHARGVGVGPGGAPLLVMATSGPANVTLWRAGEHAPFARADAPYRPCTSIAALSRDGRLAATGGEDGALELWTVGGELTRRADLGARLVQGWVADLAFTDDGLLLCASVARGGEAPSMLTAWDTEASDSPRLVIRRTDGLHFQSVAPVPGPRARAIAGVSSGAVEVWDLTGPVVVASLARHENPAASVAVSEDGALAASASDDGKVHVSRLDGRLVATLDLGWRGDRGTRLAFRPGSPRTLLVGTGRGLLLAVEVRP